MICPASLVRARTAPRSPKADEAAAWGTLCHTWKETGEIRGGSESHRATLARKLAESGVRREDWWNELEGEHEVTFAVNLEAGTAERFSGSHDDADAWKKRFDSRRYLTGTIDWVGSHRGDDWVDDLKTGFLKDVNELRQVHSYSMALWMLRGKPRKYRCHRSLTHWRKYPLHGHPERHWGRPLTALDLRLHLEDLRYAVANIGEANVSDEGCRFCESRTTCLDFIRAERTKR